ncbi:hypothetical protein SEUCBS140593_007937 [Sporothrix eucalyptigena]|uniref:Protein kinase domain-containing protein n=1 Tax=Sporothrix eucalyptigena TaxID=1812306 RepID=A0ABP0CI15_9PEZI
MDPNTPARFRKIDIRVPRLRKCPFDLDTVDWRHAKLLGTGMDGCVWRVRFGKDSLYYALKLFWDADPEKLEGCYFAAQRECQNAALLQSMRASLDQEAAAQAVLDSGGTFPDGEGNGPGANPTLVFVNPKDEEEAACNLYSFSESEEKNKVLAVERFLHLAGFQFCPQPLRTNWINGILVDHSDIVAPCFFGWHKRWYHPRTIEVLMAE